jgi:hypothetical protein
MGGVLASSAISNAYHPKSNRGVGLVFENFAISSAARMASAVLKEFVLRKYTHNANYPK